jgi:hypothetical protein
MDASFGPSLQFGLEIQTFGVMAPAAGQRTPFHEECGPDAGTIVDRVPAYIEKKTGAGLVHPSAVPWDADGADKRAIPLAMGNSNLVFQFRQVVEMRMIIDFAANLMAIPRLLSILNPC